MCQLYRHYDKSGSLLYVGISLSTVNRLSQHKNGSSWFHLIDNIKVENFPSRKAAIKAEEKAIKNEKPIYNIKHNNGRQRKIELDYETDIFIENSANLLLFSFGKHSGFVFADLSCVNNDLFWQVDAFGDPYQCQFMLIERFDKYGICYMESAGGAIPIGDVSVLDHIDINNMENGLNKWFTIDWGKLDAVTRKRDKYKEVELSDIAIPVPNNKILHRLAKNKTWGDPDCEC